MKYALTFASIGLIITNVIVIYKLNQVEAAIPTDKIKSTISDIDQVLERIKYVFNL